MKILVAYASKAGSTAEVAYAIGRELGLAGAEVDVHPINKAKDIDHYQAVVVGGAVRAGLWLGRNFIRKNRALLSKIPTAYFLVCMNLCVDTPEKRAETEKYLEPVCQIVKPMSVGYFAGKMDYSKLNFLARFVVKNMVKTPEGDFRNWDLINQWARELYKKIADH